MGRDYIKAKKPQEMRQIKKIQDTNKKFCFFTIFSMK